MKVEVSKNIKTVGYVTFLIAGILIGLSIFPAYFAFTSLVTGRTLQTIYSPDQKYYAKLKRKDMIILDSNFYVEVDGKRVYSSPDLANFADGVYRETLLWDKTSQVVVLEMMGKRIFAYSVQENRPIVKGELKKYEFYPMPNDYFYNYLKDIEEK